jgi:DNA polymerase-3 subunit delta
LQAIWDGEGQADLVQRTATELGLELEQATAEAMAEERSAATIPGWPTRLLAANEPALRIVAALSTQIRGWLWVSLLEQNGEQEAAGIANPKRIYGIR